MLAFRSWALLALLVFGGVAVVPFHTSSADPLGRFLDAQQLDMVELRSLRGPGAGNVIQGLAIWPAENGILHTRHVSDAILGTLTYLTLSDLSDPYTVLAESDVPLPRGVRGHTIIRAGINDFWFMTSDGKITTFNLRRDRRSRLRFEQTGSYVQLTPAENVTPVGGDNFESDYLVIRTRRGNDNVLSVFLKSDVVDGIDAGITPRPIHEFTVPILNDQFFQGAVVLNDYIYTVEGNADETTLKTVRRYNLDGRSPRVALFNLGRDLVRLYGTKFEPEGAFVSEGELYSSVMLGEDGRNIKFVGPLTTSVRELHSQ